MSKVSTLEVRARVLDALASRNGLTFQSLRKVTRVNPSTLGNVLQTLRRNKRIYFVNPLVGWKIGRGGPYTPMQRFTAERV